MVENFENFINKLNEKKDGFPLEPKRWKEFYDIFLTEFPDNSVRDKALEILYTIKNNRFWCTKFQYDVINNMSKKNNISDDDILTDILPASNLDIKKENKYYKTIPISLINNYYMIIVNNLKNSDYTFYKKLLSNINNRYEKNKKTDNKADVTEREYLQLQRLKNGNISQKDYHSKN